jgi:outer membrane protein assembly factor BamB
MTRKLLLAWLLIGLAGAAVAADWPHWRGPLQTGVSPESGLPTAWEPGAPNWSAELGGVGVSSPIVSGDRILVTSQAGWSPLRRGGERHPTLARGGAERDERPLARTSDDAQPVEFLVEAFGRRNGERLWQHRLAAEGELPEVHLKHNLASPSPVTDGEHVIAWFGNGQLVALRVEDGALAWKRHLGQELGPFDISWGHGSSPALHEDLVILLCDHGSKSILLALDKRTGEERWRREGEKGAKSYSTPIVYRDAGRAEMIVNSTSRVDVYDPATGELLWWVGGPHRFAIPVPSFHDGVLYLSRGYRSGPYMAVRAGGRGDVNDSHVAWAVATGAPYIASLLHYEGLLYMANGQGVVTCVDAADGRKVWQQRVGGIFSASPIGGDGKIYLASETGETVVLAAGREPRVLARNRIDGRSVATPALSGGQIFIRTDDSLLTFGVAAAAR